MDGVESVSVQHAAGEAEFVEQGARVFVKITDGRVAFRGKRMAIDVDAFDDFMIVFVSFALGADYGNTRSGGCKRQSFLPDPAIEWHWQIFNNDQYFFAAQYPPVVIRTGLDRLCHARILDLARSLHDVTCV